MVFSILQQASTAANARTPTNSTEPASIRPILVDALESFIPGYSVFSNFILAAFGFDVGVVLSFLLFLYTVISSVRYLLESSYSIVFIHFTSSIVIDGDDDLFYVILKWLAAHPVSRTSRSLKAVTPYGMLAGLESMAAGGQGSDSRGACSDRDLFSLGKIASRRKPKYEPHLRLHRLWHEGTIIFFRRLAVALPDSEVAERIEFVCLGRSTRPIKNLIESIERWTMEREKALTVIYRPEPKDEDCPCSGWDRICERPSRPIDSVVLDSAQKIKLLEDVKEFLQPETRIWYSTCGIPYRRGYLFHGPPGTGKTSLSFALAGIFGLDIYVASLMDRTLTEQDLIRLLSDLPQRCIVLLEDVDSAGLRRQEEADDSAEEIAKLQIDNMDGLKAIARTLKENDHASKQGFSLSGLLNAIDGVASHEGRILILTTNYPHKLDPALLRPGRIDLRIEFTFASRAQIREIFIRIYSRDRSWITSSSTDSMDVARKGGDTGNFITEEQSLPNPKRSSCSSPAGVADKDKLAVTADEFASRLPERTLTPAEIQGFLLLHKKDSIRALELVDTWRDSVLASRRKTP